MPTEEVILNSQGDKGVQHVPREHGKSDFEAYQAAENLRTKILADARAMLAHGRRPCQVTLGLTERVLLAKHSRPLELVSTEEGVFFLGLPVVGSDDASRMSVD